MTSATATLEVEHLTHYRYAETVDLAHHLAYLRPLENDAQRVQAFELDIDPAPQHERSDVDWAGNWRSSFTVTVPHRELRVRSSSRVRVAPAAPFDAQDTLAWEAVRQRLRYEAGAAFEPASQFVFASPFVPPLPALREFALPSFGPRQPVAAAAIELMARIHSGFAYRSAATTIDTPLTEVLARRAGVCQDFAHLMIGALRSLGLAAHYISGYLLTATHETGAQAAPMLGADASHAWVGVWCPRVDGAPARWLELDPTNNLLASNGHVRLALGRDFGDVTPLRGVIRGGGTHELEVRVRTRRLG
jgi:transglutaminase-like putative cysteine protease